ncbi:MAG: ABC transporter permease [Proteobacteria bacterium]|nr:ABC transporter permease [Pseudomonadota bacterium]MBI3497553.1 ABC transporter permease [Pseudomonadota bacterium]
MSAAAPGAGTRPAGPPPRWVGLALVPVVNLLAALVASGAIVLAVGENPLEAMQVLVTGAFGDGESWGYTLFYATNFIFAGLAVAVAFHAGLFNIGGEGQAYIGGLGVGLACLAFGGWPFWFVLPMALAAAMLFGAGWAYLPGYLQAYRGSHIVITTIMFNFLASALMTYLMVNVLIVPGQQSPESRVFDASAQLPSLHEVLGRLNIDVAVSPLNLAFPIALIASAMVWGFIWHTSGGYALRVVGKSERAAVYAGISPSRNIVLAMALSGALAGLVGINEIMGVQHRLILSFTGGVGYVGIAVALMGRNHPVGICLAAVLFGALYQGGSELAFVMPNISREMVVVIQGLVILFCGALEHLFQPTLNSLFRGRAAP